MPGGRLPTLARAMREYVQLDAESRDGGGREPSFEETLDRVERGAVSRRELLKMGGAFGAAFALAACTPRSSKSSASASPSSRGGSTPPTPHDARVAIIGAGLAGTTAAYRLWQNGVNVQLYEARDRIGGRCWTARGFANGQTAEHGGEFIDTRHVHMRGLVSDLGLQLEDLWKGWVKGSVSPNWIDGDYLAREKAGAQMKRISAAVTAEAQKIGVIAAGKNAKASDVAYSYGTSTPAAAKMDELNMEEWIDQKVPGVPAEVKTFLNVVMAGWYGLDMPSLGALNWMDFFIIPYPGGDERYHVTGGNDQVPTLAAAALPAGTTQTQAPLETLIKRTGGTYELRFGGNASSKPVIADMVILTTPWTTLRDVDLEGAGFPDYRKTAIDQLGMGTDVKLLVQYNRRPHTFKVQGAPWSGTLNHSDPNYDTWDSAPTEPGTAGLITVYAGGSGSAAFADANYHDWAPGALSSSIVGQIDQVVPGTKDQFNGKAWLDYWTGDPWTRGSYAAYVPGQMTKYWGYAGIPEGNVHFAGEHTSTYSQGFLNGGVESGQRTAIEVMEKLGVSVPKEIASLPYSRIQGEKIGVGDKW